MTKSYLAATAAVLVAAGLAGCGGDDAKKASTPSLTNFATGPVPSAPAVGAAAARTLLPATADTHEVETDGSWVVWKARQINLGYFNGASYSNLNLGLSGAVTPFAFSDCEQSPIAYDGTRIAFVANDVSDAGIAAFYYGTPGGTMRKIALPDTVTTQGLASFRVAIFGDVAGILDLTTGQLYVADLGAATPALAELSYTASGGIIGAPGLGLLPLSNAGALDLLDLSDGTVTTLTGDADAATSPEQLRFAYGAFTWVEGGKAYFYAPTYAAYTDSRLIAAAPGTVTQRNPISGPDSTFVLWEEYDGGTGATVVKQRPWNQLGQTPDGTTIKVVAYNFPSAPTPWSLWDYVGPQGGLATVQTGMGFIAWLAPDGNGDTQLFTLYVGQLAPGVTARPMPVQVTSDVGAGDGSNDSVFLLVDNYKVLYKQEFTALHSPGRVLKLYDYAAATTETIFDGREFQQVPMALLKGGKAIVLTRDHSFRLFAKKAGSTGAPVVVTPQSQDVKNFAVAKGRLVYMALDRELYLDSGFLHQYVNDNDSAEFLVEIYGQDLDAGGSPERLTFNAFEDKAPNTDGDWVTWYDENNWGYAQDFATGTLQVIGETSDQIRVSGGLAAWTDTSSYAHYADLATGETAQIGSGSVGSCPAVAGRVVAWNTDYWDGAVYVREAHYYDLAAATPADVTIVGARPTYFNWGWEYAAPVATDGRFITWVEYRTAWDHDDDAGAVTAAIDANVVAYHDLTTDTTDLVPAADWNYTGVGAPGWDGNEGPICNPKVSNGVIAFSAIEYGEENLATDWSDNYGQDLADKEIFFFDAGAGATEVVRVTNDADAVGLWDSRLRVGGDLAVWRAGGASSWGWDGKVPAVAKLK